MNQCIVIYGQIPAQLGRLTSRRNVFKQVKYRMLPYTFGKRHGVSVYIAVSNYLLGFTQISRYHHCHYFIKIKIIVCRCHLIHCGELRLYTAILPIGRILTIYNIVCFFTMNFVSFVYTTKISVLL